VKPERLRIDLDQLEERARDKIKLREDTDGMCDQNISLLPEQVLWLVARAREAERTCGQPCCPICGGLSC